MKECVKCGGFINSSNANTGVGGIPCCDNCLESYQSLLIESTVTPILFWKTIAKWRRQQQEKRIHKLSDFGVTIDEYPLLLGLFRLSLAKGEDTVFFLNKHFNIREVAEFLKKE